MANTLTDTLVKEFMSTDLVTVHAGATVHETLDLFVANRISALPLVDKNEHCVGIITATDLIEITYDIDDDFVHTDTLNAGGRDRLVARLSEVVGSEPVLSYATESVCSIGLRDTLRHAAKVMSREQVHHLPVIDENEAIVGVISTMDIVAALADAEE